MEITLAILQMRELGLQNGNLPKVTGSKPGNVPALGNREPKARDGSDGSRIPGDRDPRDLQDVREHQSETG